MKEKKFPKAKRQAFATGAGGGHFVGKKRGGTGKPFADGFALGESALKKFSHRIYKTRMFPSRIKLTFSANNSTIKV